MEDEDASCDIGSFTFPKFLNLLEAHLVICENFCYPQSLSATVKYEVDMSSTCSILRQINKIVKYLRQIFQL